MRNKQRTIRPFFSNEFFIRKSYDFLSFFFSFLSLFLFFLGGGGAGGGGGGRRVLEG